MIISYDKERLTRIIDDIFNLTGISISVLDTEMNCLANSSPDMNYCKLLQSIEGEQPKCAECDRKILERCRVTKKLERHICRAGLYDSAMPIIKHDTIVGFVIMGQVRSDASTLTDPAVVTTDKNNEKALKEAYLKVPFLSEKQLSRLYDLLPYILFDSAINTVHDDLINEAVKFIDADLSNKLTVQELCKKLHVSKNRLYTAFDKYLDTTITEYVNTKRIQKAKILLKATDDPIYKIAENVGINNYTYFCKLFKKFCGMTPKEYKKKM